VPLDEEVAFVRAYAEILARRYRGRVTLSVTVAPGLGRHPVPAFLLQPLVENAFRHGVERREGASAVEVSAAARGATLVVRVRDRALARGRPRGRHADAAVDEELAALPLAPAAASAPPTADGDGVGLGNTRERLALLYGDAGGLSLDHTPQAAVVSVWLPLDPAVGGARPAPVAPGAMTEAPAWA
jgi:LytS/YehU family sensor histidine kinase